MDEQWFGRRGPLPRQFRGSALHCLAEREPVPGLGDQDACGGEPVLGWPQAERV
jgi:hypothetical protein